MHRLEITGETPEALYLNIVKTLSIFLRGAQAPASVAPEIPSSDNGSSVETQHGGSTPSEGAKTIEGEVIPPKKTRGAKGNKATEPNILNDEIGDLGVKTEAKELTLDGDIRPRLMAIQKACTARGMTMPECVAYIQKLYGPFGVAKAPQLKPEQFQEFMEASEAYLTGKA